MAYLNGETQNERYFMVIKNYIYMNLNNLDKNNAKKLLDIFKFYRHFQDKELQNMLELQLKQNYENEPMQVHLA